MTQPAHEDEAARRLRRDLVRLLEHEATGDYVTSAARAAAAGRVLERLCQRLGLVIGSLGVRALVLRALALNRRQFSFLDAEPLDARERRESMGETLRACLEPQEPGVVTDAALSVFATVVNLLVTAIGEPLAWSLLREAWPEVLRTEAGPWENDE